MEKDKREFLNNEILTLTIQGGLGRRFRVYKKTAKENDKNELRKFIRSELPKYEEIYKNKISEEEHLKNIEKFRNDITNRFSKILNEENKKELTFGRSQKLLNLYLKYLWVLDRIPAPPHCPIDSKIIGKLGFNISIPWTKMNQEQYLKIIEKSKKLAKGNISQWELEEFNRINPTY